VKEFIDYARPIRDRYRSPRGRRCLAHLSGEYFKFLTKDRHGPCALSRLGGGLSRFCIVGQVQVLFTISRSVLQMVHAAPARSASPRPNAGRCARRAGHRRDPCRATKSTSGTRCSHRTAPPADIVSQAQCRLKDAVADPKILARFKDDGGVPMVMTPGALGANFSPTTKRAGAR